MKAFILAISLLITLISTSQVYAQNIQISVPLIGQERNLSCEAAAVRMVLAFFGKNLPEAEILASFGQNPNPHFGFRGNVDGPLFTLKDYGVHAEPVANTLTRYGISAKAHYNPSPDLLKQKLAEGKPSIVWISGPSFKVITQTQDGHSFKLVSGEHTLVLTGYRNGFWQLNDPWRKTISKGVRTPTQRSVTNLDYLNWRSFDRMAVILD